MDLKTVSQEENNNTLTSSSFSLSSKISLITASILVEKFPLMLKLEVSLFDVADFV